MSDESFEGLKKQAIDTQLCLFCGLCSAVCTMGCISFKSNGPELDGDCSECGQCLEACPGIRSPLNQLDLLVFGRKKTAEEERRGLGIFLTDKNLISSDKEIQKKGYTGGKLTATLAYLLEKKEIDAAIVSQWGEASPYPWVAWPVIANTREEIIRGAGSKYVFSPNLMLLEEIADRDDIKSLAIVGLGCHIQGLRKLELLGRPYSDLLEKVKYALGLYCGSPMISKDDFLRHVGQLNEVPPQEIAHVDFKRVSREFDIAYTVGLISGKEIEKRVNIMQLFEANFRYRRWNRCRFCTDYAAEYADISFGGTHVTCRTPKGRDIIDRAIADGLLIPAPTDGILSQLSTDQGTESFESAIINTKKVTNVQRIKDYKKRNKPVPDYD